MAETVVEREVTGIIEEYNTSVRSMIVSLSSAKSDAEQEEAKRCFHEVIASHPDVTIRGFKPADQSVAVLFEMENLAVGKIVPDIEGRDAQNADLKLSNYRGKVVLLIFWGGWCHSCHHFLPILRDLRTRLGPDGFTVVGVNSDLPSELTTFLKKEPLHWPNFSDGSSTGPISVVWNIRSWPTLCLIGADGVILAKQPSISNLEETLRPLLKEGS